MKAGEIYKLSRHSNTTIYGEINLTKEGYPTYVLLHEGHLEQILGEMDPDSEIEARMRDGILYIGAPMEPQKEMPVLAGFAHAIG